MLINSLPYTFQNVVFIGDFPKSTIYAASAVKASNKVLCNLSSSLDVEGIAQESFPVLDALTSVETYQNANLNGFSSVKTPVTIKKLIPGVVFDEVPIQCQPLESLLQNLEIGSVNANLAILNLNGAEQEYLVESEVLLNTFNCVLISCSDGNTFEGAEDGYKKLLAHFEAHNIAYSTFPAEVHPFRFIMVHRVPGWKANDEAMVAIEQQEKQLRIDLADAKRRAAMTLQKFDKTKTLLEVKDTQLQDKTSEIAKLKEKLDANKNELIQKSEDCRDLNEKINKYLVDIDNLKTDLN